MLNRKASADLEISIHDGELAALEGPWSALGDPAHPGAPFRSFAWISTWWNSASTSGDAVVLVARDGAEVVGLLPLYPEQTPFGGRRLRLMGDGIVGSDYLGVIARPERAAACARAFATHLRALDCDELQLDDLDDHDPLLDAFDGAASEPRYKCPYIRIGDSFEEYLGALPDGIGAQFHRRRKWLEKRPGFRIETLATPDEIERGMDILFDLHHQRWGLEGGSEAIDGPKTEAFHRQAARKLAEVGWSRVWVMHVEGAPRAVLYGWRHGDRLAFYQAGHEPAWRPRSVGTVLLGLVIKTCFDEQIAEFDFLRGEEPYKLRWATGFRQTTRLRVRGAGLRPWLNQEGRALYWRMRHGAKRAVPGAALEWLRVQRNKWKSA